MLPISDFFGLNSVGLGAGKPLTMTFCSMIRLFELSTNHINTSTLTTVEVTNSATCLTVQGLTAASRRLETRSRFQGGGSRLETRCCNPIRARNLRRSIELQLSKRSHSWNRRLLQV